MARGLLFCTVALTFALVVVIAAESAHAAAKTFERPPKLRSTTNHFVFRAKGSSPSLYNVSEAFSALYYVKASYCNKALVKDWTCGPCKEYHPQLTDVSVSTVSKSGELAIVGYDPSRDEIVVAWRGSSNLANWIQDLKIDLTPYPDCAKHGISDCQVHLGFHETWQFQKPTIFPQVLALHRKYPSAKFFIAGHSLGASVALMNAVDLVDTLVSNGDYSSAAAVPLSVIVFGLPRSGNIRFAEYVSKMLPKNYITHVTHHKDPVPHLPPEDWSSLNGYAHSTHEVFYDNNLGATGWKECNDYPLKTTSQPEDQDCADKYDLFWEWKVHDHLRYLGLCTNCDKVPGSDGECSL